METGGSFIVRFNEHKSAFKANGHTSSFANTPSNTQTHLAPYTTQCKFSHNKWANLNTIQRYNIYAEFIRDNHLNDEHTIFSKRELRCTVKTSRATMHPKPFFPYTFRVVTPHPPLQLKLYLHRNEHNKNTAVQMKKPHGKAPRDTLQC